MIFFLEHKKNISQNGFTTIENVFSEDEIRNIIEIIEKTASDKETFRKSADLFAIRQFLKEIPELKSLIFNENLKKIIENTFENGYFVAKSIYFDKPQTSNWYVAYHQDLTISVDKKVEIEGFSPWTVKQNQFAVQPPLDILENNCTIRIHLDDTDEQNGALKVIPKSHNKGIYKAQNIDWTKEKEHFCSVNKGGIMIMKPLLLHGSNRTTNNKKRRVIHIEFSNQQLPNGLNWSEFLKI